MKNVIAYYYDIHPFDIYYVNDKYFFSYMDNNYSLELFKRPLEDAQILYDLNKKMLDKNIFMHEIVLNNQNNVITYINDKPYVLMKLYMNKDAYANLIDICYINNSSINIDPNKALLRNNWVNLWESKNDYLEAQINEIGKKYKELSLYANYYIGLAENAIMYAKNAFMNNEDVSICASHKRINANEKLYSLYNPIELVCDYRVRDVCEYIKSKFFNDEDVYKITYEYFKNNNVTYKEALLFYARLLYPSYFFDIQDKIVNDALDEKEIEKLVVKSSEYERFLSDIYIFLTRLYNRYVPAIDWIIKRSYF